MKNKKGLIVILLGFLAILLSLLGIDFFQTQPNLTEAEKVKAEEIIDGDTIRVKDLKSDEIFRVRYLGIDTPELDGPTYESCFGSQAKEKNEELVEGQELVLEFDKDKYDRFGRTLAYVYTLDEQGKKDVFVNLELLRDGYARFYLDKQNTLWQDEFVQLAIEAHDQFLGLWGSCGEEQFDGKCVIKGNIGRSDQKYYQKYYHLPGDKYYSLTKVNLLKEDQWLCTIEEAEAKNFHRAIK